MTEKKKTFWKTAITKIEPNKMVIRGYDVADLMGRVSHGALMYLMLKGELPTPKVGKLIDALLVSTVDQSAIVPSIVVGRWTASCGVGLQSAIANGINTMGFYHGGAIEECMDLFYENVERMHKTGKKSEEIAEEIVRQFRKQKKRIPGYGHPVHTADPRIPRLYELVEKAGVKGDYVELSLAIERALEKLLGKEIPINIDGAGAAVLCELRFESKMSRAITCCGRAVGIAAHAYEEIARERPFRQTPLDEITYDGPKERKLQSEWLKEEL